MTAKQAGSTPAAGPSADRSTQRPHHDMGGLAAGTVERAEHDYAPWEKRVDAMMVLLSDKKRQLMTTDMLRRGIEGLPPDAYDRMSYYERWMHSIMVMMLERGVVTREELDRRMDAVRAAQADEAT